MVYVILQIILPLFRCLAVELDRNGTAGLEMAARLGYDDFNECFCCKDIIRKVRLTFNQFLLWLLSAGK